MSFGRLKMILAALLSEVLTFDTVRLAQVGKERRQHGLPERVKFREFSSLNIYLIPQPLRLSQKPKVNATESLEFSLMFRTETETSN